MHAAKRVLESGGGVGRLSCMGESMELDLPWNRIASLFPLRGRQGTNVNARRLAIVFWSRKLLRENTLSVAVVECEWVGEQDLCDIAIDKMRIIDSRGSSLPSLGNRNWKYLQIYLVGETILRANFYWLD